LTDLGDELDTLTSYLLDQGCFMMRGGGEFRRDPLRRATTRQDIVPLARDFFRGQLFTPVVGGTDAVVLEF